MIDRITAREQRLADVLDASGTLLGRLQDHQGEADLRMDLLRALHDDAGRQVQTLREASAGAVVHQETLAAFLTRAEEAFQALEAHTRLLLEEVHDQVATARNGMQDVLADGRSRQSELEHALEAIGERLARWQQTEAEQARQSSEIETMLERLREGHASSNSLLEDMRTTTQSMKLFIESAHQTLDTLRQQDDDWQRAQRVAMERFKNVDALMASADRVSGTLEYLCQDAHAVRDDLRTRLDEIATCRQEQQTLVERHEELAQSIAAQIKQSRKTSREFDSVVRDASVATGQVSTRTQELSGRMDRAVELIGELDARLLRAEKITQQLQQSDGRMTEGTRQASRTIQQLQSERIRTERVPRQLRHARGKRSDDAGIDLPDLGLETIRRLRLSLTLPGTDSDWKLETGNG
jgi:DNA repair exonuclease SbcCD ATPase subunit